MKDTRASADNFEGIVRLTGGAPPGLGVRNAVVDFRDVFHPGDPVRALLMIKTRALTGIRLPVKLQAMNPLLLETTELQDQEGSPPHPRHISHAVAPPLQVRGIVRPIR